MKLPLVSSSLIVALCLVGGSRAQESADPAPAAAPGPANAQESPGNHVHYHFYGPQAPNAPYSQSAQYPTQDPAYAPTPAPGGMGGYGGGGYGWGGGGGGTAAGNYWGGRAQAIQAAGQYNLYTAEAMRQAQAAREAYYQNEMQRMSDYYAARQMNAEFRASQQPPTPTPSEIAMINAARLPKRLRPDQFDASTGKIHWPQVLTLKEFSDNREKLDKLFADRTHDDSGPGSENYHDIQMAVAELQKELHDDIKSISPAEYLTALTFIDSLQFEGRFSPDPKTLAAQ